MTAKKSPEDRLNELDERIRQLQARKQKLSSQVKQKERKERTRRLIQIGAIFEKYFELEGVEEAEQIAQELSALGKERAKKYREPQQKTDN